MSETVVSPQLDVPPTPQTPRKKPTPAQRHAVRQCYITGQGSIAACCQKHGVSERTAYEWSDCEDWGDLRRAFDLRRFEELKAQTEVPAPAIPQQPKQQATTPQGEKLARIEAQLDAIDEALDCCKPAAMVALWKAKSMALDAWALLTGFPKPGTRRPMKRGQTPMSDPQPVEIPEPTEPATT